ncbi:MAG TPA: right-handed parallel beta-helix repeat-containing protein [Humisphaera sp.]|nr:right-handed parallel beta-helix repeat-containing protein [Humisphaera sp.]
MALRFSAKTRFSAASARSRKSATKSQIPARFEPLESRTLLSATWFVATNGSDSNPGTITKPFLTIQHGADMTHAGDTVDVRAGVYHETVTLHNSGTTSQHILIQPYNNESVTIDGANPITGWTNTGGDVWTAPMSENLGAGNNQVFIDNEMINEARWPNTSLDLSNPTQAIVATATPASEVVGPNSATITNAGITQPPGFWVGGSIRIGSGQNWGNQTGTITASGKGFVTFSYYLRNAKYETPTAGNPFYLFGVRGALDSPGEWFDNNGQLSVWTPKSDDPANHLVEAKARLYGFDASLVSNVRIQGFHLFACSINTSDTSRNITINQITDEYLQHYSTSVNGRIPPAPGGIILRGINDALENSVIAWSAGDGVYMAGSADTVINNVIHDIDYSGVDAAGIRIGGYGDTITHNTIYNAGRSGLLFSGAYAKITYNTVYHYGLQTTDLGGFYESGYNGQNTVIEYNRFYDSHGGGFGNVGIMLDNGASNFIIDHNIVWDVDSAMRMNLAQVNIQIYNNTLSGTNFSFDKDGGMDDWSTTKIENNIATMKVQFGNNPTLLDNLSNHGMFVNAATGNFTLLAGSPAVNGGAVIPPYTNGYVGPAPDVGALELGLPIFVSGANTKVIPKDPVADVLPQGK